MKERKTVPFLYETPCIEASDCLYMIHWLCIVFRLQGKSHNYYVGY